MFISRRRLLGTAAATASASFLPFGRSPSVAEPDAEPHFFLQVYFPGGMDPTYLFDARPRAMTEAGLLANYLTEEPELWTDTAGGKTLVTSCIDPMRPYRDSFSIVNGLIMMPDFDGHENNVSYLLTGDAFGGDSIIPALNVAKHHPLDYVRVGNGLLLTELTNSGNSVPMIAESLSDFSTRMAQIEGFSESPALQFFRSRLQQPSGNGRFTGAMHSMRDAFNQTPLLATSLQGVKIDLDNDNEILRNMQVVGQMFEKNICRGALFVFNTDLNPEQNLDTHDGELAKELPTIMPKLMQDLATVFKYLIDTPYDGKRSLMDVTTVCVTSEFGRTMRQGGEITQSGTDHNPLFNTALLAGKGIKGGRILGQSDFQTPDEDLSGGHLHWDKDKIKIMGLPFDFAKMQTRMDKPKGYDPADYINYASITNTLIDILKIDPTWKWKLGRNGPEAKSLQAIIA